MPEDVLLVVVSRDEYQDHLNRWASLLCKLGPASQYGVYAAEVPAGGIGIWLCRYDSEQPSGRRRGKLALLLAHLLRRRSMAGPAVAAPTADRSRASPVTMA